MSDATVMVFCNSLANGLLLFFDFILIFVEVLRSTDLREREAGFLGEPSETRPGRPVVSLADPSGVALTCASASFASANSFLADLAAFLAHRAIRLASLRRRLAKQASRFADFRWLSASVTRRRAN